MGIFDETKDFWFSPKHEEWMVYCTQYEDEDNQYHRIQVEINGVVIPYTTCCKEGYLEPFENALKNFPDYVLVATGSLRGFGYRKEIA